MLNEVVYNLYNLYIDIAETNSRKENEKVSLSAYLNALEEVKKFNQGLSALVVSITDDGVGRQKAAEFKSKSATKNKSFGMKVTAERIELINQLYNTKTQVSIIDLKDENGEATGTKVIIEIPI